MGDKNSWDRLVLEFRDRYFKFFPEKATHLGNHEHNRDLGRWDREGVREKITFLSHYRDLVKNSLETESLILLNIIDSHLFHLKNVKPYLRPDFFVNHALSSIDRMIYLLKKAGSKEVQQDLADALVSRVSWFPILFEHSRQWLTSTTEVSRDQALFQVRFFQEFLETDYRKFIYSLDIDVRSREKLIGVIPFTIQNLIRFGDFVRSIEVVPVTDQKRSRSPDFFRNIYKKKYMLDLTVRRVLSTTEEKIKCLTQEMNDISGGDIDGYYAGMVKRNMVPWSENGINDYIMNYFRSKSSEYFRFCRDTGFLPAEREPVIEWTPVYRRNSSPLAAYIERGVYETLIEGGVFWVCPAPENISRSDFYGMRNIYHRQFMNSLVIHELVGHHLASEAACRLENEACRFSDNLTFDEGFALYVEEAFAEEYAASLEDKQEAMDLLFFQKKAELMRAYRVIVDIGLGTGDTDLEEAARFFSEKNGLPLETAVKECEKYLLNPGVASSYLIGKLEIMELRKFFQGRLKESFSLKKFHRLLVGHGSIPLPLIRRIMVEKLIKKNSSGIS